MNFSAGALANALGKARRAGAGWQSLCPAHDDHEPSLSIIERDGKLLLNCRAGCGQDDVIEALKARGLWANGHDKQPRHERVYDYRDERGNLRYQVVRRSGNGGKKFLQRRPDNAGGWIWDMAGVAPLPYRLSGMLAADADEPVFIAEGEKDCDSLTAIGLVASTNHGGSGKWRSEISSWFEGRNVVILPDNDDVGRRHAADVARQLSAGASRIRILELPGLPEKGDVSDWLAKGGTAERLIELARDASTPGENADTPRRRFTPVLFSDVVLPLTPRCIVEDLIPYEGLVVAWGPPKSGKSFFIFDLCLHIALGWDYRGRRVEQGAVCYIAAEGELGIKTRIEAFRQSKIAEGGANPPFYLLTTRLDLVQDLDELIADLKAALPDGTCSIMVLDTLNRTMHGSENKDDDMGAYRDAADRLREEFGCTVIIIHHCGIDGTRPRGHTSLTGAVDAQLAVKRAGDKTILVTIELMKDGPEGDVMACKLVPVEVGFDPNGKGLSSCVVEHLDAPKTVSGQTIKPRKLPAAQAIALKQLHAAIIAGGEIPPTSNSIPPNTRCARDELWKQYCVKGGISDGESRQAHNKAFNKASQELHAADRVGRWDGWAWPVRPVSGAENAQ